MRCLEADKNQPRMHVTKNKTRARTKYRRLGQSGRKKGTRRSAHGGRSDLTVHRESARDPFHPISPSAHPSSILHLSFIAYSGSTAQRYRRQQERPAHHSLLSSNKRSGHAVTHLASHKRWRYMWRNRHALAANQTVWAELSA
jgi:hypothetical protein